MIIVKCTSLEIQKSAPWGAANSAVRNLPGDQALPRLVFCERPGSEGMMEMKNAREHAERVTNSEAL
jgi:hypothetical protein